MNFHSGKKGIGVSAADDILMDVGRRIQLSPTKHAAAEQHYRTLCDYVDRVGSPLEGRVLNCYPGGSFATGTAIASNVSKDQHDVDVVLELDVEPDAPPARILTDLFNAINGESGSRYNGITRRNSRCVTVTYGDGTTVDLMPLARFDSGPDYAGHLFHWKPENREEYHKPVNPKAFAEHFNAATELSTDFAAAFEKRKLLAEGMTLEKAETTPLPDHVPLTEKSPRVVAIQLLKRFRDVAYRKRSGRKPPSIVMAALALETATVRTSLLDEVTQISGHIASRIECDAQSGKRLRVFNPTLSADEFTDRWPEGVDEQLTFARDLSRLNSSLRKLRDDILDASEMKALLDDLFGESVGQYGLERHLSTKKYVAASIPVVSTMASGGAAARSSTFAGGEIPE